MIKGWCYSNDKYLLEYIWPTVFAAVPRVGERVQVISNTHEKQAKIISVIHTQIFVSDHSEPRIKVMLVEV